jgi:hypothetical protein
VVFEKMGQERAIGAPAPIVFEARHAAPPATAIFPTEFTTGKWLGNAPLKQIEMASKDSKEIILWQSWYCYSHEFLQLDQYIG